MTPDVVGVPLHRRSPSSGNDLPDTDTTPTRHRSKNETTQIANLDVNELTLNANGLTLDVNELTLNVNELILIVNELTLLVNELTLNVNELTLNVNELTLNVNELTLNRRITSVIWALRRNHSECPIPHHTTRAE